MKRFLYRFGYEAPVQWQANQQHGWDDESSSAFWVVAETADDALAWGREVSEALVKEFFQRSGWAGEIPSWKESGYANWIEDPPGPEFTEDDLEGRMAVRYGELPPDLGWLMR